jgi:hypothetical protein
VHPVAGTDGIEEPLVHGAAQHLSASQHDPPAPLLAGTVLGWGVLDLVMSR